MILSKTKTIKAYSTENQLDYGDSVSCTPGQYKLGQLDSLDKDSKRIRYDLCVHSKLDKGKGAEGKSFDDLLRTALQKQELEFDLNVLCNDSTACLYTGLGKLT